MNIDDQIIEQSSTPNVDDVESRIEKALYGEKEPNHEEEDHDEREPDGKQADDDDSDQDGEGTDDEDGLGDDDDVDLATYLGLESDQLEVDEETGEITFLANVDGEQQKVKIQDLVKSYQLESYVNKKSQAVAEERRQFEAIRDAQLQVVQQNLAAGETLAQMAAQQLMAEFDMIDMDKLRAQQPEEWAAVQQEMANRGKYIQDLMANIGQVQSQLQMQQQAQMTVRHQKRLEEQYEQMLVKNPSWVDQAVRKKEQGVLKQFLTDTYGFTADEFKLVSDNRLMSLIQDANRYHSGKKIADAKQQKEIPKYQKPGKSNKRSTVKARQVKELKGNLRKTGSTRDAAALLENRM